VVSGACAASGGVAVGGDAGAGTAGPGRVAGAVDAATRRRLPRGEYSTRRICSQSVVVVESFRSWLAQLVSDLRHALDDSPTKPRYVETVARRGYLFIALVEEIESDAAAASRATEAKPSRRRTWRCFAASLMGV
jgi:hypothetical protein